MGDWYSDIGETHSLLSYFLPPSLNGIKVWTGVKFYWTTPHTGRNDSFLLFHYILWKFRVTLFSVTFRRWLSFRIHSIITYRSMPNKWKTKKKTFFRFIYNIKNPFQLFFLISFQNCVSYELWEESKKWTHLGSQISGMLNIYFLVHAIHTISNRLGRHYMILIRAVLPAGLCFAEISNFSLIIFTKCLLDCHNKWLKWKILAGSISATLSSPLSL